MQKLDVAKYTYMYMLMSSMLIGRKIRNDMSKVVAKHSIILRVLWFYYYYVPTSMGTFPNLAKS